MPPSPEFTGSVRIDTVFNCDHIFPDLFLYLLSFNMSSVNSCPHIHKRSWRFSPRPFQCGKTASVFERAWTGFFHWGEVCIVVIKMGGSTRKKKQTNKQTEALSGKCPGASFKEWGIADSYTRTTCLFSDNWLAKPTSVLHAFSPLAPSMIFFPFFLSGVTGNCAQNCFICDQA